MSCPMTVASQECTLPCVTQSCRCLQAAGTLALAYYAPGGTPTARMHAHPCPAVISARALERVVVWGNRGWFAGEPGDQAPAADMADTHQTLPLLSHCTALLCTALLCSRVVYVRWAGAGLTLPRSSTAGDEWQGGGGERDAAWLPLNKRCLPPEAGR